MFPESSRRMNSNIGNFEKQFTLQRREKTELIRKKIYLSTDTCFYVLRFVRDLQINK